MLKSAASLLIMGLLMVLAGPGAERLAAQTPAAQTKATPTATSAQASLAQLMKGILYPASNVIFSAQDKNPAEVTPAKEPSTAANPLESTYGKWEAVENAGLAMAEGANLLTIPGRKCGNGRPVPMRNADWAKFVQGLREAGMKAYQAGKSKDQDKVLDSADAVATACANCHDKYREKPERCM